VTATIGRSTSGLVLGLVGLFAVLGLGFGLVFLKLSPLIILVLLIGAATVAVSAFRPYLGVHVIVALLFFEGVTLPTEGATAMRAFGALLLAGWLAQSFVLRRTRIRLEAQHLFILLFIVWSGLSALRSTSSDEALIRVGTFMLLAITSVMVASVVDTPGRMGRLLAGQLLWTAVAALIALALYYSGTTYVAEGLVKNRNLLALYLNLGLAIAFLLYVVVRGGLAKFLLLITMPLLLLTLGLTLSRTGLIVMMATLVLVGYRLLRQRGILMLTMGGAAICLLAFVLPDTFWSRAGTILPSIERQNDTFGMRVRIWQSGIRMVEDHPIFGVGPANFKLVLARYSRGAMATEQLNAHNAYVVVAAETGLPGLALFLGILATGAISVHRVVRSARAAGREDLALCGIMVETMMFVILCTGITMTVEGMKILWIVFGLGQAVVGMARRELHGAAATAPALAVPSGAETAPV